MPSQTETHFDPLVSNRTKLDWRFLRFKEQLQPGEHVNTMIRFLLLQNRAGKTRLAKYYVPMDDAEKHTTEYEVHKVISTRDPKFTNFVEVPSPSPSHTHIVQVSLRL